MSDALMLPASLSLSPELCVLDVLSLPARSTNDNWLTQIWVLSCTGKYKIRNYIYLFLFKSPKNIIQCTALFFHGYQVAITSHNNGPISLSPRLEIKLPTEVVLSILRLFFIKEILEKMISWKEYATLLLMEINLWTRTHSLAASSAQSWPWQWYISKWRTAVWLVQTRLGLAYLGECLHLRWVYLPVRQYLRIHESISINNKPLNKPPSLCPIILTLMSALNK